MDGSARDLAERLRAALAARPEILEGYLFGSHARGEARAHSDVDPARVHPVLNERLGDFEKFARAV